MSLQISTESYRIELFCLEYSNSNKSFQFSIEDLRKFRIIAQTAKELFIQASHDELEHIILHFQNLPMRVIKDYTRPVYWSGSIARFILHNL